MTIDSHLHLWATSRGDYGWIPKGDPVLDRSYAPRDAAPILQANGIDAVVLIQAAPSLHETEYMLGLADSSDFVQGVVGWINFEDPSDLSHLQRLKAHPRFKGVRPMIQDIADDDWMLRADVQWAFTAICDLDLTFDALGFARHLGNFHTILTRYPTLRCVIDHGMKPQVRDRSAATFRHWADGMARLAQETRACVKLSGLVTEADPDWSPADLQPFVRHLLAEFGPERIMWGSDWPVCRLRAEYGTWLATAQQLTAHLPAADRTRIFGGTAAAFYRLWA